MKSRKMNRILSLLLAMVMVVGVFVVPTPDEVSAATKSYAFESKKASSVTIKDADCYTSSGAVKANYIKFKSGFTGYITLKMSNASKVSNYTAGYLTLCNSKKKSIGATREVWSTQYDDSKYYTRTYGVKKGQTYYFKVEAAAGVKIKTAVKAVSKKYTSQKKAKTLKAKTTVGGVIIANDKTADWYKISVPANKRVKITVAAKTNGDDDNTGIKATLMKSNGKPFKTGAYCYASVVTKSDWCKYLRKDQYGNQYGISDKKGTYYIKVERLNKSSNGYYTVKWQTY